MPEKKNENYWLHTVKALTESIICSYKPFMHIFNWWQLHEVKDLPLIIVDWDVEQLCDLHAISLASLTSHPLKTPVSASEIYQYVPGHTKLLLYAYHICIYISNQIFKILKLINQYSFNLSINTITLHVPVWRIFLIFKWWRW